MSRPQKGASVRTSESERGELLAGAEFEPDAQAVDGVQQVEAPHYHHYAGVGFSARHADAPHHNADCIDGKPENPLLHEGKGHQGLGDDA